MHRTITKKFEKLMCQGHRVRCSIDELRPERLMISEISNVPFQLLRDAEPPVGAEGILRQHIIPDDDKIPSDEKERGDRILAEEMPDDYETTSEKQEGNTRAPPQLISDDDEIPSDEEKGNSRISPQEIQDDDKVPSELQEVVGRILPNCKIPCGEIFLLVETGKILLFKKRTTRSQYLSFSLLTRCIP